MRTLFRWIREEVPGASWRELFQRAWPAYRRWFLSEGERLRPDLEASRRALRDHMPELEPMWDRLGRLTGANPEAARMLALYRPPPYIIGCTQAVWTRGAPILVRNYDYHPEAFEGLFLLSNWHGTQVLAASDCLWGVVDGMNEHGLAVALSYGGSRKIGPGFGIPLILRYVLEFCTNVKEAVEVLSAVPSHMAYNVSLLDRSGAFGIAYVGPGSKTRFVRDPVSTNHQDRIEWKEYVDRTKSSTRKSFLTHRLKSKEADPDAFVESFLDPPLHVREYQEGRGTLYTAAYRPREGRVDFLWPSYRTEQSFARFIEANVVIPFQSS